MPISYSVKNRGRFIHVVASGAITPAELLEYQQALGEDERIDHGNNCELFDATKAVGSDISQEALQVMAERLRESPEAFGSERVAIVINGAENYEKARYYEELVAETENIIVFNEVSTALTWLGVEDSVLR